MNRIIPRFSWTAASLLTTVLMAEASRPNVILILADDLGYGDLSCYGQEKFTTPNIDRLADEGMRFTQHYSGNTVCTPSRACLMTGQHPGQVYVRGNLPDEQGAELDPAMTVLPELFKAAGYATGAFGKWGLGHTNREGPANPLAHGFDHYTGWKSQTIAHTYYPSTVVRDGVEVPLAEGTYVHGIIMDDARAFVRRNAEAGTPFFCFIPTAIPHAAMHAPPELHEKWRHRYPEFEYKTGRYGAGSGESVPDVPNPVAAFPAMLEQLDNDVGSLFQLLEEYGIEENTLVLFSSDNGPHGEGGHDPEFWDSNGPLRGMKRDLYEGGIRVPLLAWWPGTIAPGRVSTHLAAHWDHLPTFAELLGQPLPPQATGFSFLPELQGRQQMASTYLYWEFLTVRDKTMVSRAVRMGDWKAVQGRWLGWNRQSEIQPATEMPLELYHLESDPGETTDLSERYPHLTEMLLSLMDRASQPLP